MCLHSTKQNFLQRVVGRGGAKQAATEQVNDRYPAITQRFLAAGQGVEKATKMKPLIS